MKQFNELAKNLKKDYSAFPEVRIAILGDNSTQFLNQAIKGIGFEMGIKPVVFESDFDQIEQQILFEDSEMYQFNPEFVIIYYSSYRMMKRFYSSSSEDKVNFAMTHLDSLENLYGQLQSRIPAKVICYNFQEVDDNVFGNYANKTQASFLYQLRKLNFELMNLSQRLNNLFINDLNQVQSKYGLKTLFDSKLYYTASLDIHLDILPHIAGNTLDIIQTLRGKFNKCLILDLDNTLWGGVIGDDGIDNIQLGDLGIGKAFVEFQQWAKQLKERGIILAVCSKNEEENAKQPFREHPDMVLKLEDISVFVANWDNKADNIRQIQEILNIGFDSMVFIDDNPYERNLVKEGIPEICVPKLPEDPTEYLTFLRDQNLFETSSYSENDAARTQQYQTESERIKAKKTFTDPAGFLESLKMKAEIRPFDSFSVPRVAQLTQRSNQFNLRTVRYTEEDIQAVIDSPDKYGFAYSLSDKYGNYGIISLIILQAQGKALFIDTWIMSCRVLKRGMEMFVRNNLATFALENGFTELIGEYLPTQKNSLVKDHYKNMGFTENGDHWILNLNEVIAEPCYIEGELK